MNKRLITLLLLLISVLLYAQPQNSETIPDRIILNLTENPASEIAVTWRTVKESADPKVEIAPTSQWIEFIKSANSFNARKEKFVTDRSEVVYHYSAVMGDLEPATKYVYRVGSDSVWSEWNHFTTASNTVSGFSFVYLGDPQNDLKEHCSRLFRETFRKAPDARFWLIGGDLVTDPLDHLWGEFFYAAGFIPRTTPLIAAPGNHDHTRIMIDGKSRRTTDIGSTWTAHFTLPENGLSELKETNYYIDYQGTRFIIINSQSKILEQAVWLEKVLQNNGSSWTIVCFHHPVYSTGSDRDSRTTREAFQPLFDKYGVDLVLTGHDHTYARSKKIFEGKITGDDQRGTVYVVSVSGPKAYDLGNKYDSLMVKTANNIQLFQVIDVKEKKLIYNSYTVDGQLFDSFELTR